MNEQIDRRSITQLGTSQFSRVSLTTFVYEPLMLTHSSVQTVEQISLIPSLNVIILQTVTYFLHLTRRTKGNLSNRLNYTGTIIV